MTRPEELSELSVFEAALVREAGQLWDQWRAHGGPRPELDWLWDLVRLARHARTRGTKSLSERDRWWLAEAQRLYRDGGFARLSKAVFGSLKPKQGS